MSEEEVKIHFTDMASTTGDQQLQASFSIDGECHLLVCEYAERSWGDYLLYNGQSLKVMSSFLIGVSQYKVNARSLWNGLVKKGFRLA